MCAKTEVARSHANHSYVALPARTQHNSTLKWSSTVFVPAPIPLSSDSYRRCPYAIAAAAAAAAVAATTRSIQEEAVNQVAWC
ncbi:hypothetical protein M0802_003230 [Mischocyttarus mexicanus]|nr:hypothetical protein M0802_003230 [Mischocyttarus mexicanus]